MLTNLIQLLNAEGQRLTEQIRSNTPKVTGKTERSLAYEVTQEGSTFTLQITAKKYFRVVETGRKPTPDKKPSKAMIENISEWLTALGKEQSLAWAIATSINKKGTKLYRDGGREDVFSNVLSNRAIDKLTRDAQDIIAEHYLNDFLKNLEANKLIKDGSISN